MAVTGSKVKKTERREYTLMVVPHQGQAVYSIRVPMLLLKYAGIALAIVFICLSGVFLHYRYEVQVAQGDKAELDKLRQVNGVQVQQIEQLAKATASLQDDMNRLNTLDSELRRMVSSEDSAQTSRAGVVRPSSAQGGQGGPVVKPQPEQLLLLVKDLQESVKVREQSLLNLKDAISDKNSRLAATPSIWPASGEVTSRFGWRGSPWGGGSDWHPGIDIADDYGTPIYATADGVVVYSGWYAGYGKLVQIDHGNGIHTLYGHNSENLVEVGQSIKKGQHIARMGSTGYSTGTHVHYEVRVNDNAVNPANFL